MSGPRIRRYVHTYGANYSPVETT